MTSDAEVARTSAPYATPEELRAALVDSGVVHLTAEEADFHQRPVQRQHLQVCINGKHFTST